MSALVKAGIKLASDAKAGGFLVVAVGCYAGRRIGHVGSAAFQAERSFNVADLVLNGTNAC